MSEIKIERQIAQDKAKARGVFNWPIWEKEESSFPWTYDSAETCYFLEGDVIVTPNGGEPVQMGKGDMVTFPVGLSCSWEIRQAVRKHYRFD